MPPLISELSQSDEQTLLEALNYLNMGEIKAFCKRHGIPYSIWIESDDGVRRKTKEFDRKGVILGRIRHYLKTAMILDATCFPAGVVCFDDLPKTLRPTDRLFYGQYDKKSDTLVGLLADLTDGRFRNGALARILAREFWSKGIAPTFQEFAASWLEARENHKRPKPEWAFLSDRADGKDTANWKRERAIKAEWVVNILNKL